MHLHQLHTVLDVINARDYWTISAETDPSDKPAVVWQAFEFEPVPPTEHCLALEPIKRLWDGERAHAYLLHSVRIGRRRGSSDFCERYAEEKFLPRP